MALCDEADRVPAQQSVISSTLSSCLASTGLGCLTCILEQGGICTFSCLGKLSEEELAEICQTVRAAGFGPGHARSLRELCRRAREEVDNKSVIDAQADAPRTPYKSVSVLLQARLEQKELQSIQAVLMQSGVQSFSCLKKLSSKELEEVVGTVLAMGLGQTHAQALRDLHAEAQSESGSSILKKEPTSKETITPITSDASAFGSLIEREQRIARIASPRRTRRDRDAMEAGMGLVGDDFRLEPRPAKQTKHTSSASESSPDAKPRGSDSVSALSEVTDNFVSLLEDFTVRSFAPLKPELHRALLAVQGFKQTLTRTDVTQEEPPQTQATKMVSFQEPKIEKSESNLDIKPSGVAPKIEQMKEEVVEDPLYKMFDRRATDSYCRRARMCREAITDLVSSTKAIPTQVIKYRDRATDAMLEARVPDVVLALLQLHASCSGKEVSEQRLARMAMDVMEEQAYDPIRAVASLSPSSILCPCTAMRVLGSGFVGIVFLEEESGEVVKVMLEDFAKKEYDVFVTFFNAGIAPRPLAFSGPVTVPGGELFSIRMQRVHFTLHQVLSRREPKGVRHGFSPPSEKITARIAAKLVAILQCMWDKGLVHGDLHLHNVALQDADVQTPLLLLDFGRSSSNIGKDDPLRVEALRAGHEYDVYRLILEMCEAFDELVEEWQTAKKECEKELRELKRTKAPKETGEHYQLHHNRQIVGLQAYLAEEPQSLEQLEQVYTTLITSLVKYANAKFALPYDGVPCVRSRRLRQSCTKQQKAAYHIYFKSDLFWDGINV
mmetsp:Transcript_100258/g.158023  ORF Transcript_100258/g.158023 Transcript_100258/m.158023 type:complete len:781 (+) Transcript_100258:57-2399(+)